MLSSYLVQCLNVLCFNDEDKSLCYHVMNAMVDELFCLPSSCYICFFVLIVSFSYSNWMLIWLMY
jgi:hypothetical protein